MSSLKQQVVKGVLWQLMEKAGTQIVGFIVGVVLARLLSPSDFGTVALTGIFFAVTCVLVDCGFGNALIQKKDADDLDYNSIFYLNLALSLLAYIGMFFAAPWIADFYHTPELVWIVRVSSCCFLYNAINAIQSAWLTKHLLFNLSFKLSLISCFTSAVCGITFALLGWGVWALVWSSFITGIVGVIARWFIIGWRPKLMFSWTRLKPLFSYGWKLAASGLLDQFFVNLNGLLIGKFYTKADLAFVNKGQSTPNMAMGMIDGTLGTVSFPALAQIQDDKEKLREAMRKMIQCSTFLVFPLMVGVACCSKSWILLIYGEKWLPAVPYMWLACFTFALWPFHTINLRGIMVLGRSDIFLKLEIIKKAIKLLIILVSFRYGVFALMAASAFALGPLGVLINAWPNRKLLNYTIRMQLMDVLPTAAICAVMSAVVFGIDFLFKLYHPLSTSTSHLNLNLYLISVLTCQFIAGASIFAILAYIFRLKPAYEYARMLAVALENRCPKFSSMLLNRFSTSTPLHDQSPLSEGSNSTAHLQPSPSLNSTSSTPLHGQSPLSEGSNSTVHLQPSPSPNSPSSIPLHG